MIKIAFFADTHIDYKAYRTVDENGINVRLSDGYKALEQTVDQILERANEIDLVVHGGDIFHSATPSLRSLVEVNKQFRRLADAGLPVYVNTGNHDVADDRFLLPATSIIDDSLRGIHAVTRPLEVFEVADGVFLHMLSHHGLDIDSAPRLEPRKGCVNLFCSHGSAFDPSNDFWLKCADSPREQLLNEEIVLSPDFSVKMLGHIHSRSNVAGLDSCFYAGSALRRGFSDSPGGRGWSLITVDSNGVMVGKEDFDIWQRPQYDLPVIDARGLSGVDLTERIVAGVEGLDLAGAIVRQKVSNVDSANIAGVNSLVVKEKTALACSYALEFKRAVNKLSAPALELDNSEHVGNVSRDFESWLDSNGLGESKVVDMAKAYLDRARIAYLDGAL